MLFAGISDAFFLLLESHGFNRGRMSKDYRMDFLSKLRIYMNNGIIPDNNLILTFESPGHPLDIAIIMDKLEEFFFTVPKELRNDY